MIFFYRVGTLFLYLSLIGCNWLINWQNSQEAPLPVETTYRVSSTEIAKNSSIYEVLMKLGVNSKEVHQIIQEGKSLYDLSKIRVGAEIFISRDLLPLNQIRKIKLKISEVRYLVWRYQKGRWQAIFEDKKVSFRTLGYSGEVEQSLWDSALNSGLNPQVIIDLAEILAWQVDFSREVRKGDRWRILVNRRLVDGKPSGWGRILATEYKGQQKSYIAILYPEKDRQRLGYFDLNGRSMRGKFLKSPIKFGRISSRFQRNRFHPILKIRRPHLGVDYAAPRGTPIRSVGEGVVFEKGYNRSSGNVLKIRHNSVYKTAYRHLRGFAKGVKKGNKVRQGQIIGYVGSTGLATGPHLHFEFYRNGRFIDPLGQSFPRENSLPDGPMETYKDYVKNIITHLPVSSYEEKTDIPKFHRLHGRTEQ